MDLVVILALAALIEGVVEYFKKNWSKWSIVAVGFGLLMAFGGEIDMLASAGLGDFPWWLSQGITGLALGFGSSFLHDFVQPKRA